MPDIDPASGLPIGEPVDTAPAQYPERVTLVGRRVKLEPLDPAAHGDSLYASVCLQGAENDRLWLYLFSGPFADRVAFDRYLRVITTEQDTVYFAIVDQATGNAVGHAAYMRMYPQDRTIEVGGVLFSPALQRSAAATEAMYLMAEYVFERLGYRRYEWKCNALNAPSRRAAQRLGFTYEGVFRQHLIVKGRSRDTAWFSMLDSEWPARKAAFLQWLEPANFDAEGRQKTALSALNQAHAS
jgi:RimJ/RimL family protein N-acetyltransferase